MTNVHHDSNAARTVHLALVAWGLTAAALAASPVLADLGAVAAFTTAAVLAALAWGAYAADPELREAARATPRTTLFKWALAFDAVSALMVAAAAASGAPFGHAIWQGLPAMAPLFALPVAVALHAAVRDGARAAKVTLSGLARSPARSPAGT